MEVLCVQSPRAGAMPAVPQSALWQVWLEAQQPVCTKALTATWQDRSVSISLKKKIAHFQEQSGQTEVINVFASPLCLSPGARFVFSPLLQNQCV